jgi:hypothetical protein
VRELRWAPYVEFGIPDQSLESSEVPAGPVIISATGYRGDDIIIILEAGTASRRKGDNHMTISEVRGRGRVAVYVTLPL